jgi:hypothetical protein
VHPNQISQWKQEFLENSQKVFSGAAGKEKEEPVNLDALYAKIGQLETERDFLKKYEEERTITHHSKMINPKSRLSIRLQCQLLSISRASFYYSPKTGKSRQFGDDAADGCPHPLGTDGRGVDDAINAGREGI